MSINPLDFKLKNLLFIPERLNGKIQQSDVVAKVEMLKKIFQRDQGKVHIEIFERILKLTERSTERKVREFRREFIFDQCCQKHGPIVKIEKNELFSDSEMVSLVHQLKQDYGMLRDGILTISENVLKSLKTDEFWNLIHELKVKNLIIQREKKHPISYEGEILLDQLAKKNLTYEDLTEEYTLKFDSGDSIIETKAKLRLCGDYFEALFNNSMRETKEKLISLSEISLVGFSGIVSIVETKRLDKDVNTDEYVRVAERLQYNDPRPVLRLF